MTKTKLSLILIAIAAITGCDDDDDDDLDVIPGETDVVEWRADLLGVDAYAAIRGEAQVSYTLGAQSFMASIEVLFDEPNVDRPWHVHFGSCATDGAIVGPPEAYPPLMTNADGTDTVSVLVPERVDPAGQYHVNVHLSADQLGTIIACGDLNLNGS